MPSTRCAGCRDKCISSGAREKLHAVLDSSAVWRPRERTDRRTLLLTGNPASRARRSIPRASQLLGAKPQTFTEFTTYRLRKATVLKALADARAATRPRGMEATAPRSVHPAPRPGLPLPRGQWPRGHLGGARRERPVAGRSLSRTWDRRFSLARTARARPGTRRILKVLAIRHTADTIPGSLAASTRMSIIFERPAVNSGRRGPRLRIPLPCWRRATISPPPSRP